MSNSKLPNGGYSLTNGSNYMLDGFQFDTEYGNGVYEKARLPEAKGLTTLPSGMIPTGAPLNSDLPTGVEVDLDLDLSEMTKDASEQLIPLVDHSWLASNPQENLDGMRSHEEVLEHFAEGRFEHPQVNQMKTLEESWADGSTTGLEILPNKHREHDKYQNSYRKNQSKLPGDSYRQKVEQGSRRVAYGENLDQVVDSLSLDGKTASRLLSDLSDEYGLHGRVYVKEASFPGLFNGRWDEVINKRCATSMYIIPSKSDCVFDRFLGMKVVASVKDIPWKEAYHSLMPKLETYGVTKVSGSSYASMLRQAFVDVIEGRIESPVQSSTWFQIQPDQTNLISIDKAKVALDQFEVDNPFIETQEQRHISATESRLERIATQLVSQNLVESEIVEDVLQSDRTASAKIDRLYEIASQPVSASSYEGQGKEAKLLNPYKSQLDPNAKVLSVSQKDKIASAKKCQEKVAKLIQQGLISISEVEEATKTASSPEDKLSAVYAYLSRPSQVHKYMGEVEAHYMTKKSNVDSSAQVENQEVRILAHRNRVAQTKIAKMIESGLISYDEVALAIKGKKTPEDKVASVFAFLATPKKVASYNQYRVTEHRMIKSRNKPLGEVPTLQKRASANLWKEAHSKVDRLVSSGLLSQEKYDSLNGISDPNDFVRKAFDMASMPSEASDYQGGETAHFLNGKKSAQISETEVRVATWLRQKMSEGSAGEELDILLSARFSQNVLQDHKTRIASLRNEHEGVSGHAYVDAEAYMTQGTDGCEKGALVHRANQIPTLLKTAKCGTCVFNVGGTCQKYNKMMVKCATEIVENKDQYQTEMIRLANASDSEKTASLFVNNYDESEFGLAQADSTVNFSESPSVDEVGEVLFGGFEV